MSEIVNEFRRDDARVLDRLVDGELAEVEERELLAALDDEPGAWRRCALAFLEARAWKGELGTVKAEASSATLPARKRSGTHIWGLCLAAAASLLVAFGLGLKLRGTNVTRSSAPAEEGIARQDNPAPGGTPRVGSVPLQLAADQPDQQDARWQTFTLGLGDGEAIELPAREAASFDPQWLENQSSAVPPDVLRLIEQSGHEVRRQRRLWPIQLQDGRRLIVPVEQLELQYVGGSKFQ